MKKAIILFVFQLILIPYTYSQTYTPFPEHTAVWDIYFDPPWPNSEFIEYRRYIMEGDTILNNIAYNKIYYIKYKRKFGSTTILSMQKYGYHFGIRQDTATRKVYVAIPINNVIKDTLLFDFNLKIGDSITRTYTSPHNYTPVVRSMGSVTYSEKTYKTILANSTSIIEGIGSVNGLIEEYGYIPPGVYMLNDFCNSDHSNCTDLLTLRIDKQDAEKDITVFPNPFTDNFTIKFDNEFAKREIVITDVVSKEIQKYSCIGNELLIERGELKNGVYLLKVIDKNDVTIKKIIAR